jgi:hypothetical protein
VAVVISDLDDFIDYVNTLYESDSTAPSSGDEDYTVWTALANIAIDIWENEEGMLWRELFVKLADAADGDKTTAAGDNSYAVPTDFRFPASGYVWFGSGTEKTAYKVIPQEEIQLYENTSSRWCYFLMDGSPTLEINPNLTIQGGYTISYNYYKTASKLTTGSDTFEMSDPMFAVFYALSELKKEEGDISAAAVATQKLEAMKTRNVMPSWFMDTAITNRTEGGFGT